MQPPTMPRCAGLRCGRRVIRRPPRPVNEENGADGFFLDIEGAAHLFGGEERAHCRSRFAAGTKFLPPGAACRRRHARRRLGSLALSPRAFSILPSGQEAEALAPLPIEALRLSPEICATLRRLGFKSVGALLGKPRAPFAARFSAQLLRRLDQALGRRDEPLVPIVPPPVYHSLRYLLEPIVTQEAVVALSSRLMGTLTHVLRRDDVGARALKLSLYRVDGEVEDARYRADAADAQRRPCGAHDRAEARCGCGDRRRRLRLRGDRPCRHPRRTDAGAADGTRLPPSRMETKQSSAQP